MELSANILAECGCALSVAGRRLMLLWAEATRLSEPPRIELMQYWARRIEEIRDTRETLLAYANDVSQRRSGIVTQPQPPTSHPWSHCWCPTCIERRTERLRKHQQALTEVQDDCPF